MATMALMALWLGVILCTFGNYGMSWDEHYRQVEGAKKLTYYQNLFSGHYAPYDSKEDLYPGFFDLLHQGVNLISPLGLLPTGHLLEALFAWLGVWGAYHLARRLGGEKAGFIAALCILLFPNFYGHAFINPKDIPFAAGFIWSLYYIVKAIDGPLNAKNFIKLGLCIGITTAIRSGGVLLMGYLLGALICRLWLLRKTPHLWMQGIKYLFLCVGVAAFAFLVMLPFWPYAHPAPFKALLHTLQQVAHFPWNGAVLFNGQIYAATDLPWFYLPEMLLITTPEFFLGLGLVGLGLFATKTIYGLCEKGLEWLTPTRIKLGFVLATFLFPIAIVCIRSATLYDGVRHFIFVLPVASVLLGLLFARLTTLPAVARLTPEGLRAPAQACPPWRKTLGQTLWALLAIQSLIIVTEYAELHPYQYAYYNHLVGGTRGAWGKFEIEYWGTAHREAVEKLAAHLAKVGDTQIHTVTSPMAPWLVESYLPPNLVYVTDGSKAEFYISFMRFRSDAWSDGNIMEDCIVSREDVPLALVKDRRKILQRSTRIGLGSPRLVSSILSLLPAL
jgi:hypothetical protein